METRLTKAQKEEMLKKAFEEIKEQLQEVVETAWGVANEGISNAGIDSESDDFMLEMEEFEVDFRQHVAKYILGAF